MKTYPHLFAKLFGQPLMLHAPVRTSFERTLLAHIFGETTQPGQHSHSGQHTIPAATTGPITGRSDVGQPGQPDQRYISAVRDWKATDKILRLENIYQVYGSVAVIQIHGVIDKIISQFEMDCYGGCDLADIDQALSLAANDPRIERIVLDIHSPGGSVIGVADTAARIAALRATKEVHAYIPGLCCSAGYYLASQADQISAAQSAIVGSIGVYCAILDASEYYAELGAKMQFIKAGQFKTMGTEWRPLTAEETAFLQTRVDANYAAFKTACTDLRTIADSTMQGQSFYASEALDLNLVDELTGATLDEYVSALLLQ